MDVLVTRWVNEGQGYKKEFDFKNTDSEAKELVGNLKSDNYKRVRGSGLISIEMEKSFTDKSIKITFERVVE